MRNVVLYTLLSLDGVAEAPDQFLFDFDDQMQANLASVIEDQDAVLLGRRMYDEWAAYWPSSSEEPFASFINGVHKYVASSTELGTPWANASRIEGSVTDFVRELEKHDGADIGVHGSIALAQSLLAAGLIDELRLVVAPALVRGRRLFDHEGALMRLTLVSSVATSSGSMLLHYRVSP